MIILLFFAFSYVLNAETFYLEKRSTPFYSLNVQINGTDITSNFIGNKLVIDEYLIEGPNMLSICFTYNSEVGVPNVKQLAKVELYNTKVSTRVRGLASLTPKSLIPEYISVSPQSKKFKTENQQCFTHNFEDYTLEQLQAMEAHFNPITDKNHQVVETTLPEDSTAKQADVLIDNKPEVLDKPVNDLMPTNNQSDQDMMAQEADSVYPGVNTTSISDEVSEVVSANEPVVESVSSTQPIDEVTADEALNFIPDDDFVPTNKMSANQQSANLGQIIDTPNEMEMASQDIVPKYEVIESNNVNPLGEPREYENNDLVGNNNSESLPSVEASEVQGNEREVASDKETLSDEDFFSELDLQEEGSEAK